MSETPEKHPRTTDTPVPRCVNSKQTYSTDVSAVQLSSLHARLDSKRQEISALKLEIQTLSRDRESLAGAVAKVNGSWTKVGLGRSSRTWTPCCPLPWEGKSSLDCLCECRARKTISCLTS